MLFRSIGNALKSIFSASIIFLKDKPYSNKALLINVVLKWFLNKEYKINIKDEQSKSLLECNSILANEIVKEIYLKKDVPFKRSQKETLVTTEGHFILDALKTGFDSLEVDLNGLIDARKSNVNVLKRFPFFLKVLMCVKLGAVSNYFVDEFLKESLKEATFNIGRVIVGMKPLLLSRIRFLDEMEAIMVTQEMPMDTLEDYDSLAWDLSVFHYKTQLITKEKDSCGNEFRQPFICHDSHVSEKKEKIKTRGLSNQNGPSVDALTVKNSPKPMLSDATHGLINAMTLTTQRRDDFVAGLVTSMVAIKHHVEPRFLLSMEEDIANTILNAKSFKSLDDRGQLRVVFLLDLIRNQALSLETFFSKSKARVFFEYTLDKTLKEDRSIQLTLKGKFIPNENASGVIKLYIDDYAPNNYSVQRLSLMVKGTQISSFQIHKKVHN